MCFDKHAYIQIRIMSTSRYDKSALNAAEKEIDGRETDISARMCKYTVSFSSLFHYNL